MKNLFVLFFSLLAITVLGQRSGTVMTSYNNSSAVASTTVTENSLPSIEITSPSDGDTLTIDTSFTASVTATDSDGTIDSVAFFINDMRQAVDVSSPYNYSLPTSTDITRELKARAYDNELGTSSDSITYYINDTTTPAPPAANSFVLDSVATIMDFTWSGDSLEVDTTRYESNIGSEISTIYDYSDNFDWPWSGSNKTLAYRTDLYDQALPNAYEGVDRFGNSYIRFENANDVEFSGNTPGTAPSMSNTDFAGGNADTLSGFTVLYLNQNFYTDETFGGSPFNIRERTSRNTLEIAGTGAEWSSGSGVVPRAQLLILEFQQDANGDTRMWVNGDPWDNGNAAQGADKTTSFMGYQTPANGASHLMYLHTVKIGALTTAERAKMYNWLESKYYTDSVIFPNIKAVNNEGNYINYIQADEAYYMNLTDSILIDNTPIVEIEWKWALHYWENTTGVSSLSTQKFLETVPEANNDTLFRNDFSNDENWSKLTGGATNTGMGPTNRTITVFYRVTDAKGRKSPWLMGTRRNDNGQ